MRLVISCVTIALLNPLWRQHGIPSSDRTEGFERPVPVDKSQLALNMVSLNWRVVLTAVAIHFSAAQSAAQSVTSPSLLGAAKEIALYPGIAPGSEGWNYSEIQDQGRLGPRARNVVRPVLLYYPAPRPTGAAMIVAPGGGNRVLMMSYEGYDVARKLNEFGVDAFVLKYRLIYTGEGAQLMETTTTGPQADQDIRELAAMDGRRSVELLRSRASEFKLDPNRIGMIGFSAGRSPIRGAMTGDAQARPNFVALIYAAGISGSAVSVPEGAPPLFLAVAADDSNYEASIDTFLAWRKANVPAELHIFQMGAHGFLNKGGGADNTMDRLREWMQLNGWLAK